MFVAVFALLTALDSVRNETVNAPSRAEVDAAVEKYFDADRATQRGIEELLDRLPPLTEKEVSTWRTKLFARAKAGRKAKLGALEFFVDEKRKLGKYYVGDSKSNRLVIAMHGGGAGSGEAEQAKSSFGAPLAALDTLAIFPEVLRKTEHGWGEEDTERFVLDLIEAVKRTRKIDCDRIYLTGHSMGGYGTYTIGARHADTFAGLAAFAGAPTPYFDSRQPGAKTVFDIEDGILPNLRNVPIYFYQSRDDLNVSPEVNVWLAEQLPRLAAEFGGYLHRSEIVDGRGHGFPEKGPTPGLSWAFSHTREATPPRVLWQPHRAWKRMFYWLWWEEPHIGAEIDVAVDRARNEIAVRAAPDDAAALAFFVDPRLVDVKRDVVVTINGAVDWKGLPVARLSTLLRTIATRNDPQLAFAMRIDPS